MDITNLKLKTGVLVQAVDDEMILLDPSDDAYYGVNEIGLLVLENLKNNLSLDVILLNIVGAFEIDAAQAQKDVEDFLNDLLSNGVLVRQ